MEIIIIILLLLILVNLKIRKMAKISTYPKDAQANYNDKVIGTDATTNATYNYTLQQVNNPQYPRISTTFNYQNYLDNDGVLNFSKVLDSGIYIIDVHFREKDNGAINLFAGQGVYLKVDKFENINDNQDYYVSQFWRLLSSTTKKERVCLLSNINTTDFSNV